MAAEKVNLLTMYQKWSYLDKNNNYVSIPRVGRYINGSENTATQGGQSVDFLSTEKSLIGKDVIPGFKAKSPKGTTYFPTTDNETMEKVRVGETGGTHNVPRYYSSKKYTDTFVRE